MELSQIRVSWPSIPKSVPFSAIFGLNILALHYGGIAIKKLIRTMTTMKQLFDRLSCDSFEWKGGM